MYSSATNAEMYDVIQQLRRATGQAAVMRRGLSEKPGSGGRQVQPAKLAVRVDTNTCDSLSI